MIWFILLFIIFVCILRYYGYIEKKKEYKNIKVGDMYYLICENPFLLGKYHWITIIEKKNGWILFKDYVTNKEDSIEFDRFRFLYKKLR